MDRKQPDISDITLSDLQDRQFPSLPEYRIVLSDHANEAIHTHTKENTSVEICGVLIGNIFKDHQGPFLEITDAIRGEGAVNLAGQVTFTQDTWSYINEIKDSKFPDQRIVGWYHTHPRFGIFLSPQDIFIQENFFSQPWQVAFVIDPVSDDEGFFIWHEGQPIRIDHYWVAGREKSASEVASILKGNVTDGLHGILENVTELGKKRFRPIYFLLGTLFLCVVLALMYMRSETYFSNLVTLQKQNIAGEAFSRAEEIKRRLAQYKFIPGRSLTIVQKGDHISVFR